MNKQNPNIGRALASIKKNQQEAEYKKLLTKISDYYRYSKEDRRDIDVFFNADPLSVILALRQQADTVDAEIRLG